MRITLHRSCLGAVATVAVLLSLTAVGSADPIMSTAVAIKTLEGRDDAARIAAAEALAAHAEAGDAVAISALIGLLDATLSKLRYHAGWGLARTGAAAVPALRDAYRRAPDDEERARIAQTLGRIGLAARAAEPELIAALEDPHSATTPRAAYALGAMRSRRALPALVQAYARARKLSSQREMATAIDAIGSDQSARRAREQLVAVLVVDLVSSDDAVKAGTRSYVVDLLRVVHRDAPSTLPTRADLKVVVPLLQDALADPKADTLAIVRGLGYAGSDAAGAVPVLRNMLGDPVLAGEAERALAAIATPEAQGILADLVALASLEKRVRAEYSLADHQGRMRLLPFYVIGQGTQGVRMEARFLYDGDEVRRPTHIIIFFESYSPEPRFVELSEVEWRADGQRVVMRDIDRRLSKSRLGVIEYVSGILSVEHFERLVAAGRVTARVASLSFEVGSEDRAALRHFAAKIPAPAPAGAAASAR